LFRLSLSFFFFDASHSIAFCLTTQASQQSCRSASTTPTCSMTPNRSQPTPRRP
jgi:hypothetical protein